ncbi:MAG: hypothetical protein J6X55_04355 [Victivallales bacterium]|nr:hypothetical protein [Victivallales bacterium]
MHFGNRCRWVVLNELKDALVTFLVTLLVTFLATSGRIGAHNRDTNTAAMES